MRRTAIVVVGILGVCLITFALIAGNRPAGQNSNGPSGAYSLLRLAYREPRLLPESGTAPFDQIEYEAFRRTQASLLRGRYVINAALRHPGISALAIVKERNDPAAWLASVIQVDFPDDCELMRVSLRGKESAETAQIVNAITQSYLSEVVGSDRQTILAKVSQLQKVYDESQEKSRQKRHVLETLLRTPGQDDRNAERQKVGSEEIAEIRRELRQIKLELIKANAQQASQVDANTEIDSAVLEEQIESVPEIRDQVKRVADQKSQIENVKNATQGENLPHLAKLRQELEVATRNLDESRSEFGTKIAEKMKNTMQEHARSLSRKTEAHISMLTTQKELLEEELAACTQMVEPRRVKSIEVDHIHKEIELVDRVAAAIGAELERLKVEMSAPMRVTLLEHAE